MKKKWFLIFSTSVVVVLLVVSSLNCASANAAISHEELGISSGIEDVETEAVVIDAAIAPEGNDQHVNKESRSRIKRVRNGKQYYYPYFTNTYFLPGILENGNGVGAGVQNPSTFGPEQEQSGFVMDITCVTNQGQRGNCETFEKCFPLLNLPETYGNETNYSNLQEEIYDLATNKKCSSVVHAGTSKFSNVCCDLPSRPDDNRPQFLNSPLGEDSDSGNSSHIPKYSKIVNTWATCGEKQFDFKIIGGQESIPHEYPWMVSLWGKSGKHICGASLIDNNFVLTAAHCIARYTPQDVSKIRLYIGDHNIHSDSDGHHEVRSVSRIIKHKRFSLQTFVNDIALLKLNRPVPFTDRIRPICLPPEDRRTDDDPALVVAGWGQTSYKGVSSSVLRKVLVPGVSNEQCGQVYNIISPVGITADMLCAGGSGVDSCIGDSGGPLVKFVDNMRYEQVGIVSFGRECGTYPGVYTKVHSYLNWIEVNRKKH